MLLERLAEQPGILELGLVVPVLAGTHTEGWLFGIQGAKRVFLYGPHTDAPSRISQLAFTESGSANAADMER